MKLYNNTEVTYKGCPGCAYANHEFSIPCGIAFENDRFNLSQDWELPIEGFLILSPKRHIEKFSELTTNERNEMFEIVDKIIKFLRDNNICDRYDIIFEEKRHLHVWILPRHEWMNEITDDIIENIGLIFEYAKNNFKKNETYEKIDEVTKKIKESFNY